MTYTLALFPELDASPIESGPFGLRYAEGVISPEAQADLFDRARTLDFSPFDFRGFRGTLRIVSFGLLPASSSTCRFSGSTYASPPA
jgi:hypothetical protein